MATRVRKAFFAGFCANANQRSWRIVTSGKENAAVFRAAETRPSLCGGGCYSPALTNVSPGQCRWKSESTAAQRCQSPGHTPAPHTSLLASAPSCLQRRRQSPTRRSAPRTSPPPSPLASLHGNQRHLFEGLLQADEG